MTRLLNTNSNKLILLIKYGDARFLYCKLLLHGCFAISTPYFRAGTRPAPTYGFYMDKKACSLFYDFLKK